MTALCFTTFRGWAAVLTAILVPFREAHSELRHHLMSDAVTLNGSDGNEQQRLQRHLSVILVPSHRTKGLSHAAISSATNGIVFDLTGQTGSRLVAWPAENAQLAFLAIDRNADQVIDNAGELFSNRMLPGIAGAFTALITFEGPPSDAELTSDDPLYHKLLLWVDANRNGRSDRGELQKVHTRLAKIGLGYSAERVVYDSGVRLVNRGWAISIEDLKGTPEDPLTPLYEVQLPISQGADRDATNGNTKLLRAP